jgi:hypothetical protein
MSVRVSEHLGYQVEREMPIMRCVFTTEIKVDIDMDDDEQRAAFIQLVTEAARNVYGPAAMIAKKSPTITITQTSREGKENIPLFDSEPAE